LYQGRVKTADSLKNAIEIIQGKDIDLIFFDFTQNDAIDYDTLKTISLGYPGIPVIVFVDALNPEIIANTLSHSAQEIIEFNGLNPESMKRVIEFAKERKKREIFLVRAKTEMERDSIDLTNALREVKTLMVEVEKKNEELKELNNLKSNFVSIVSHELRTPLTYIREGIAQVLEGLHGEINQDQKEFLSIAIEGMDRLSEIVNNLLDISKIEAGKINLRKDFVDIGDLIQQVIAGFKNIYRKKNLFLVAELPGETIMLFIDSEKIIQVLNNLISNAFKFTNEGGVTVRLKKKEEEIEVSVIDTGMGMSKQNLDKVFDKFIQIARKDGPGMKGTGLGLGIAKGLVELHNGTLQVTSELNKGSTFIVTLPLLRNDIILRELIEDYIQEAVNKEETRMAKKILVVDDEPYIVKILSSRLRANGYDVIMAYDGVEGLAKAKEGLPDLVIADVMMPNMDGPTMAETLKNEAATAHIPVIFLTALVKKEEEKAEENLIGGNYFMAKPYNPEELLSMIKKVLGGNG
ncbi:MAG: response regulator, partial [Spirochaetales bacterium]|nr:response regulator [Spirochaetales bacterium]